MRSFPIRKSSTRRVTPQIDSCSAIRVDSLWLARLAHRVVPRDVFVKGTGSEAWLGFCPRTARGVADFFSPVAGLSLSVPLTIQDEDTDWPGHTATVRVPAITFFFARGSSRAPAWQTIFGRCPCAQTLDLVIFFVL